VTNSVEDAKRQMREAAEAAEPKNHTEAVLSEGGIPSNTADLLKQRAMSGSADQAAHESMQGQVCLWKCLAANDLCLACTCGS
jgi:hypothetical protein